MQLMITKRIVICIHTEMCVEMNMFYFWFDSVTNILFNFDVSFFFILWISNNTVKKRCEIHFLLWFTIFFFIIGCVQWKRYSLKKWVKPRTQSKNVQTYIRLKFRRETKVKWTFTVFYAKALFVWCRLWSLLFKCFQWM